MFSLTDFISKHLTGTFFSLVYTLRDQKCHQQYCLLEFVFISNYGIGWHYVACQILALPKLVCHS